MPQIKKYVFRRFFKHIYLSYIPNNKDNLKQIILKVLFMACLITLITSAVYLADYFWEAEHQSGIIDDSRELWHKPVSSTVSSDTTENTEQNEPDSNTSSNQATILSFEEKIKLMQKENSDFKGWITIGGTQVDNPIYQASDNDFYLNHNQLKQKSIYGALYFDYRNKISKDVRDKNLVIYGHEMKNGSMFGSLKKLKSLTFYKKHPTIELTTLHEKATYKIYSIFILNSLKEDDNGYIYNVYRQNFQTETAFNYWVEEAFDRSIINTGVDVNNDDDIVTLITCSEDFPDARLVVMARKIRENESLLFDTSNCTVNANPRYPKKWYDHRNMEYPFAE